MNSDLLFSVLKLAVSEMRTSNSKDNFIAKHIPLKISGLSSAGFLENALFCLVRTYKFKG